MMPWSGAFIDRVGHFVDSTTRGAKYDDFTAIVPKAWPGTAQKD
jgi:hypothetical protein